MRVRMRQFWDNLQSSLWFVPAVLLGAAVAAALALVALDHSLAGRDLVLSVPLVFEAGPEGARGLLASIAGSMLTVAGVVFSVTVVALSLASNQFSPRVLRSFMRDRANQVVLGMLLATFTYCLLILRTVRSGSPEFVPALGVTGAIALALIDTGLFIFFIHHIAQSIQVSTLSAEIAEETVAAVQRLFPESLDQGAPEETAPVLAPPGTPIPAPRTGFLQLVAADTLLETARRHDQQIVLNHEPGTFLLVGQRLAQVYPAGRADAALTRTIQGLFAIGSQRTMRQDVGFGIAQLEEIAVKALSPGINDPTTATTCLGYLGAILREVAGRAIPSPVRREGDTVRVIAPGPTFSGLADLALDQIRRYGQADVQVLVRMLDILGELGLATTDPARCAVVDDHLARTMAAADAGVRLTPDRERINTRCAAVCERLATPDRYRAWALAVPHSD
jgi:uncharacterized membrane protein